MADILIGVTSELEAVAVAPLARVFARRGVGVRLALRGGGASDETPSDAWVCEGIERQIFAGDAEALEEVARFSAAAVVGVQAVLVFGFGRFSLAILDAARRRDALSVRLGGGERAGDAADRDRRLVDHAADRVLALTDAERDQLLMEGLCPDSVLVVGAPEGAALTARSLRDSGASPARPNQGLLSADEEAAAPAGEIFGLQPAMFDAVVDALLGWLEPSASAVAPASQLPTEANASGRTFDDAEARAVRAVLTAGTLNSTRGTYVHRFEREFAAWLGVKHAVACANGSAAVHCALAALKLDAGDEVVTTPITDMGALTPIWYEGAVPVFADVDPTTLNVTAETIAAQLTDRTRAIIVTHLFGRPCEMGPIMKMADARGVPVIEDSAQAFGATLSGKMAGTFGAISAFSFQQGKHITTGEGGVVCTNDDDLARQLFLYVNKAFGYGDAQPDHYFPALNYRMTELQGAVACAQLPKLEGVIAKRRLVAAELRDRLSDLPGITCPQDPPDGRHAYWKWSFLVDADVVCGGAVELGARMRKLGVACAPRYVQKPAFECQVFRQWRAHPVSRLPLQSNPRGSVDGPLYDRGDFPGAVRGLDQVVVLPINERYASQHAAFAADAIRAAHQELTRG